jgi:hypothetical protein
LLLMMSLSEDLEEEVVVVNGFWEMAATIAKKVKTWAHIVNFMAWKVKNLKCRRVKVVQIKEMENGFVSDSANFRRKEQCCVVWVREKLRFLFLGF